MAAFEAVDEVILVTNPEIPAITDALKTIKVAEQKRKPVIGIIMTKVRRDEVEMQPETVKEMLEVPILGMVPHDLDGQRSLKLRDAVVQTHPQSKPARAYKEIASKVLDVPYNSNQDTENPFTVLFKKLGLIKD